MSDLDAFKNSGKHITSRELVEAVENVRTLIHSQFENSPSKDSEGREECYRQLKGIELVMINLISENWS